MGRNHNLLNMEEDDEEDPETVKLRNKKRKKPKLTKSQTLDTQSKTNFGSFYMEKGVQIASLQKRTQSSSFLSHREKCIEKQMIAENKSESRSGLTTSTGSGSTNKNRFLFQRVVPTNKKRKRDNNCLNNDNQNLSKKRKLH